MSDTIDEHDASLCEWLKAWAGSDFEKAAHHPYTYQIGAGTASDQSFSYYLIQDFYFVQQMVKALDSLIEKAPDADARHRLTEFRKTVTSEESDYFERSLGDLNITFKDIALIVPCEPIVKLSNYILNIAQTSPFYQGLTALLACEWVYENWAVREAQNPEPERYHFAEWIRLHACPDFSEFVEWLRVRVNQYEKQGSGADFLVLAMIFTRVCQLETEFWDDVSNHV